MNLDGLLDRWRHDEISDAELAELTSYLATREGRARLRQDWFLDASLPVALKAASAPRTALTSPPGWIGAWRAVIARWHPTWRWAAGVATLAVAAVWLWHLGPGLRREPNSQSRTATIASQLPGSATEDLRELALLVAEPPVPVLNPPQAAWLSVLAEMTEGHR